MHDYERLETYQVKKILKKLEETFKKKIGVSERDLGVKRQMYRERDRQKWVADRTRRLNRPSVNFDRCRCQEVLSKLSRKVLRKWSSTEEGVEEQPTISSIKARSIDLADEKLSRRQKLSRSIHQMSRRCRDCDKKNKLGSSIDSQVSRRCRASF